MFKPLSLPLHVHESCLSLPTALPLRLDHGLTIYDSVAIALAKELGCMFIIAESDQQQAALNTGVTIKPISDFTPSS